MIACSMKVDPSLLPLVEAHSLRAVPLPSRRAWWTVQARAARVYCACPLASSSGERFLFRSCQLAWLVMVASIPAGLLFCLGRQ